MTRPRGLRPLAAAVLAAAAIMSAPTAPAVRAADDALRLQVDATYTLDPAADAVHVTLDVVATNLQPNRTTATHIIQYYYAALAFPIHDEARAVRATQGGRGLRATLDPEDGFQALEVRLASPIYYRGSARLRITYDLPGGAPRSSSPIRVGDAFATFYAWAWGDPGRSSVRVVVPAGYESQAVGASLRETTGAGGTTLEAGGIDTPEEWYAIVHAERPAAMTEEHFDLGGGQKVVVRAWPEDAEWSTTVSELLREGLPVMRALVGLDWPVTGELEVLEVHTPLLEGYAGVYFTDFDEIQIGEELEDLTIVHEALHAWFNGDMWRDRWINEGFANQYGALVLDRLGRATEPPDAPEPGAGAVPLSAWSQPGRIDDAETDAIEAYGYETSWWLVQQLVDEIGVDRMSDVIAAADAGATAYRGAPPPERHNGANNWRRFLDLLEEIGGSESATELFRELVVERRNEDLLDRRNEARLLYADLLEAGAGWAPPYYVRWALATWQFQEVAGRVAEARGLLERRDAIESDAEALGLEAPASLRTAYEAGASNLNDAMELAARQQAGLDAIDAAADAVGRPRDPIMTLGLWGAPSPEQDLREAGEAWESDDGALAMAEAEAAVATISQAGDIGRERALIGAAGSGGVLAVGGALLAVLRRRKVDDKARSGEAVSATGDGEP